MQKYDNKDRDSILTHARIMLGKSLREVHADKIEKNYKGKGGMGSSVEELHFEYDINSESEPDFNEAGVELKCTPLKELQNGSYVSKERLVLNIINYIKESDKDFYSSSFWQKNKCLLMMFYLHEQGVNIFDMYFRIVRLWEYPPEDLKIIMDDWNKIHKKIVSGHAHELSEGDTFYLGACTKGSKAGAEMRIQPNTDVRAPQRAYSLKQQYVNNIILDSLLHPEMCAGMKMTESQKRQILSKRSKVENAVKSISEYKPYETFEELIQRRFAPYYGMTVEEISEALGVVISYNPKAVGPNTCRAILGVKANSIAEFEKANVQMKTIRLEHNGNLVESMVFDVIKYPQLVREEIWEESALYNILTQRFLFVVFRKSADKCEENIVLEKVFFWTMPFADLEVAKGVWEDTKNKVTNGDYNHFVRISDDRICHVRPKAVNSLDLTPTPDGGMGPKKAFWLNRGYILSVVRSIQ